MQELDPDRLFFLQSVRGERHKSMKVVVEESWPRWMLLHHLRRDEEGWRYVEGLVRGEVGVGRSELKYPAG